MVSTEQAQIEAVVKPVSLILAPFPRALCVQGTLRDSYCHGPRPTGSPILIAHCRMLSLALTAAVAGA